MPEIALLYSDTILTSLTFDDEAEDQELFTPLKWTDPVINTAEDSGTLLNGRKWNHVLWKHYELDIVISADEIDATMLAFLQAFWTAPFKYLSIYGSSWGDYIQVMTAGGKFPVGYVEDLKDLPEVSFTLSYTNPV